jgi:hypothetical protein
MAKGIVEEAVVAAERRNRWRRAAKEVASSLPSWDAGMIQLMTTDQGEHEMVDA